MQKNIDITGDMLAPNGKRIANYFIDLVMQYIILFLGIIIIVTIAAALELNDLIDWFANINQLQELFLGIMVMIIYYGLMETLTQRTVGKFITNTIVVMADGSKPDSRTIFLRTLCRLIPFEVFSFLGDSGRGWHDSIMETYVVNKKAYDEAVHLKNSFDEIGSE